MGAVPELVYDVLTENGGSMHYKEIASKIAGLVTQDEKPSPRLIASIHTEMNMDNRFQHLGDGIWDLKDRAPKSLRTHRKPSNPLVRPTRKRPEPYRSEDYVENPVTTEDDESDWFMDYDDTSDGPEA